MATTNETIIALQTELSRQQEAFRELTARLSVVDTAEASAARVTSLRDEEQGRIATETLAISDYIDELRKEQLELCKARERNVTLLASHTEAVVAQIRLMADRLVMHCHHYEKAVAAFRAYDGAADIIEEESTYANQGA